MTTGTAVGSRRAGALLLAAFAGLGATAASIPSALPALAAALDTDLAVAPSGLFAGLLVGVLASRVLLTRFATARVLALGSAAQAIGVVGVLLAGSAALVILFAVVAGVGFGLSEAAGSLAAKQQATGSATTPLAALTAAVAIVAATLPFAVAASPAVALGVVGAAHAITAVLLAVGLPRVAPATDDGRRVSGPATRHRSTIVIVGVALVVTVGVETIFSGWSAVIPAEALELDASTAALGTTVFWSLMTVGRLLGWLALARGVTATVLGAALAGLAALALIAAALLRTDAPLATLAGAMVAVVAIAPLYSLLIGSALDRADPADASRLIGVLVAAGAVGGAVIPLGALLAGGAPSAPLVFALAGIGCAVLGALFTVIRRSPTSTGSPASTGSPNSPRGDHA